jgi:glutathione S-transferase kappa 1
MASKPSDTLFSTADVERIVQGASSQELKDALKRTTQQAVDRGAFGAPWLWVRNRQGKEEPFFGSDRFVKGLAIALCEYC